MRNSDKHTKNRQSDEILVPFSMDALLKIQKKNVECKVLSHGQDTFFLKKSF